MKQLDRYYGLGRHKTAVARVHLCADTQEKMVNGKLFEKHFFTVSLQQAALAPLLLTSQNDVFGLKIIVTGGGVQGQAHAVRLGIARALVVVNPQWRKQLKHAGMLTRDARVKERKKPGLKRARRAPQFSKR